MAAKTPSTVWITGASSGIGEAFAREYSRSGAFLVLSARRESELERVKASLAHPDRALVVPLDITDDDATAHAVTSVIAAVGDVDLLINSAGIDYKDTVRNTPLAIYRKVMDTNFFGGIALTLHLLPHMRPGSQIVSVTSVNGLLSDKSSSAYSAAKHALHGFYDALRAENSELTVSTLVPGFVKTPITVHSLNGAGHVFGQYSEASLKAMPADRFARKAARRIARGRSLIVVAGPFERFAISLHRHLPRVFYRVVRLAPPEYVNSN